MKAAVLHQYGDNPRFEDFITPIPAGDDELIINVRASSIKQLDKLKASGKHYTSYAQMPTAVGVDGAGLLVDGTRVYAMGITGMLAEQAIIAKGSYVVLPDHLSFELAAALPNALIGSDAALLYRANIQEGNVVLINGATGVSGKIAVQMAKYRGASKVIVTGRNEATLASLQALGADEVVALKQTDEAIINQIKAIQNSTPIDIVLDYLWGHPVELLLAAFKSLPPRKVKIITIGEMAGADIVLPSGILRSTQVELLGSGIGSIPKAEVANYMKEVLPIMFQLAAEGKLQMDIEIIPLSDIAAAWQQDGNPGKRIVITI